MNVLENEEPNVLDPSLVTQDITTFQEEVEEENEEVNWSNLQWDGMVENSLVTKLGQYVKSQVDDEYNVPGSIDDLEARELSLQSSIDRLEAKGDDDPKYTRRLQKRFEEMQAVSQERAILQAAEDAESPSIEEIWDVVADDPERFVFNLAQETINKPELIAAGVLGGWGFGVLGAKALMAANIAGNTAKVAKVAGSITGAYTGGLATGTVDRMIESANKTGKFNFTKSYEQSQLDGIIGVAGYGLGSALKGTAKAARTKMNAKKFKETLRTSESTDFGDIKKEAGEEAITSEQQLEEALHPVNTEVYMDPQGNTHILEIQDDVSTPDMEDVFELMGKAEKKLAASTVKELRKQTKKDNMALGRTTTRIDDLEALQSMEPKVLKKLVKLKEDQLMLSTRLQKDGAKLRGHGEALRASEKLYGYDTPQEFKTPEFVDIEGPDGLPITLKRVDPELSMRDNGIVIDGYSPTDMSMNGQASGYQSAWAAVATNWFRSATAPLNAVKETSPTAKLLLEKLNPDASNPKVQMWSLQEDMIVNQGYFNNKMGDIIKRVKDTYPGKDFEQAVMHHMRGSAISDSIPVQEASIAIRNLLTENFEYLQERGVKIESVDENYLPRIWDKKKLESEAGGEAYVQRLMIDQGRTRTEAQQSLKKILTDFDDRPDQLTVGGKSNVNKQPFGERSLNQVKDADISDLLSENFFGDITKHLMRGVRRGEMAKVFGDNGDSLRDMVTQVKKEAVDAGRPLTPTEAQRFLDIYNSFNGAYRPIDSEGLAMANNTAATVVNLSKLGMATITSLTEPLVMLSRLNESSGIGGAFGTYAQAGRAGLRKVFKGMKEHEMITEAREMGLITDQAIAEMLDGMQGVGMDGVLSTVNHKFFKLTMLHQWTEISRGMAYGSAKKDIEKTVAMLAKQGHDATRSRWLTEVGINPEEAVAWANNGADISAPFYGQLKRASIRMANEIIANPNPVNKALWMSSPKMKLVAQLKTYPIVFGNVILKRQWDEFNARRAEGTGGRKAANLAITATTMTMGYLLLGSLKDNMRGNEVNKDDMKKARDVARAASALLGPIGILSPIAESFGERYAPSSMVSTLSPAAGSVVKLAQDPVRGLIDIFPGSTLLPTEFKKKMEKSIKK